jgi:hypothetical protein
MEMLTYTFTLKPLFFHHGLHSCHAPDALADAMALVTVYKVEQDLQRAWREEGEQQLRADHERILENER